FYNDAREATTKKGNDYVSTLLEYRRLGFDLMVGRRLDSYFFLSANYRFEGDAGTFIDKTQETRNMLPMNNGQSGRSYVSSLTFSASRDSRNDLWLPTSGTMFNLSVKLSSKIFGSSYDYAKFTLEGEILLPTFKGHSWKLKLFGGIIQGDAPFFERFYLGDYFYFSYVKPTLPRVWEINVTGLIAYNTVAVSGGMEYAIPVIKEPVGGLYRGFVYAAILASGTSSVSEIIYGKTSTADSISPVSFDLGMKLDTSVGVFTISVAYWTNLLLMLR
ncbi:MAG: BamA/TamA family outer membrane protein, partial [Myxococcota bacterium]